MDKSLVCIPIACGIIKQRSEFLIKRSSNSRMPDVWEFPGGKMELNENIIDCLKREVKEETNLDAKKVSFLGFNERYDDYVYKIIFGYIVEGYTGEIKLSDEHTEYKWLPLPEILKENIGIDTKFFVERFLIDRQF